MLIVKSHNLFIWNTTCFQKLWKLLEREENVSIKNQIPFPKKHCHNAFHQKQKLFIS